eukprot:m.477862 g.477862  ORF g.477862 m.477862 type:complete len:460 (-) comp20972_c0_seq1:52-1431(-)
MGCLKLCGWTFGSVVVALAAIVMFYVMQPPSYTVHDDGRLEMTDLSRQDYPVVVSVVQLLLTPFANSLFPLLPQSLMDGAAARTGLSDWGDKDDFFPAFDILLKSIREEAGLSPVGRFLVTELMTQLLSTRLRLTALLQEHGDAIRAENITKPLIIAPIPRSGSTVMHNTLAASGDFRVLPYFEALEPLRKLDEEIDSRIKPCEDAVMFINFMRPLFRIMHTMTPNAVHEELQLTAIWFNSILFEASYMVPSYATWRKKQDQVPVMQQLKLMLQVLQWQDRLKGIEPKQWLLKTPGHVSRVPALQAVFPDARILCMHRDPIPAVKSLATLASYMAGMNSNQVQPKLMARQWATNLFWMADTLLKDRTSGAVNESSVMDLEAAVFWRDYTGVIQQVYRFAGREASSESKARVAEYLEAHPRQGAKKIIYSLKLFDMSEEQLRQENAELLQAYSQRFLTNS